MLINHFTVSVHRMKVHVYADRKAEFARSETGWRVPSFRESYFSKKIYLLYKRHVQRKLVKQYKHLIRYRKTCVKRPLSRRPQIGFQDQLMLNAGQSIAECSEGSILQYFRPSLSYHLSLRYFFFIFEWPFYTGITVFILTCASFNISVIMNPCVRTFRIG